MVLSLESILFMLPMRLKKGLPYGIGFTIYPISPGSWLAISTWLKIKTTSLVDFLLFGNTKKKFIGIGLNINLTCLILLKVVKGILWAFGLLGVIISKAIIEFILGSIHFMLILISFPSLQNSNIPLCFPLLPLFLIAFLLFLLSILGMLFLHVCIIVRNLSSTLPC